MPNITPCLWFDREAEDAAKLYVSLFPNSKITKVSRYPEGLPGDRAGQVLTVEFELDGKTFTGLNGGPQFPHSEAISFQIYVKDQAELDHYWDGLIAGRGEESRCGWLKDRFGVSWQVVPEKLAAWMTNPQTAGRVSAAFMPMKRLDLAVLEKAAAG
ncbi:VOC family protein [Phenylobacterium sp.]|jgi:predicted 3-demethylubiquinone-9 3-methyltransferase (glyoxalase superfamily)|uniref:VOC family protein n=1 Tax=Phenylobacterium sp. TaxID=1871053 RepID=UPI002F9248C4